MLFVEIYRYWCMTYYLYWWQYFCTCGGVTSLLAVLLCLLWSNFFVSGMVKIVVAGVVARVNICVGCNVVFVLLHCK